ncbi:6261_t:CDS:2 [Ambispora gerdemannii]|uniref:6261_t:CDS:1 n=1 Tax=Ambispora gerdemannii TaxID=144530 RepID=A0A9N9APH2_9GLOM|nr:6261_t:CDS:2 [Ambispora gerdemannii]
MITVGDVLLILVAILFPPAAVLIATGCSADFCINICLTILGYIPGHIHAFYVLYKKSEERELLERRHTLLSSPSMPLPGTVANPSIPPTPPPYTPEASPAQKSYGSTNV